MKVSLFIALLAFSGANLSAQMSNRMKVVNLFLKKRTPVIEHIKYTMELNLYTVLVRKKAQVEFVSLSAPIPKFQLPHGAIVCRFEEYVQLHSPFKLNIGLAGQ